MSDQSSFLPYGRHRIEDEDIAAVVAALRSSFLTSGPEVLRFEEALALATGARFAVAVSSGTAALHLAYLALDLKPGDAAIVPAVTFVATANAARLCGAEVEFSDVDPETGLMTVDQAQAALTRARKRGLTPRLLVPVHLGGQTGESAALADFAASAGLSLIEDACHSLGGTHADGAVVGSCSHALAACFSFHAVKTIAMGEGGAITTSDEALVRRLRRLRDHGLEREPGRISSANREQGWSYEMQELGLNARASDIVCALGRSQLSRLTQLICERENLADLYDRLLAPLAPRICPVPRTGGRSGWHLYRVLADFKALGITRQDLMASLRQQGIGSQIHYIPVTQQPYYMGQCDPCHFAGSQAYFERCLTLPLFSGLTAANVKRVVKVLAEVCEISLTCVF